MIGETAAALYHGIHGICITHVCTQAENGDRITVQASTLRSLVTEQDGAVEKRFACLERRLERRFDCMQRTLAVKTATLGVLTVAVVAPVIQASPV